MGRPLERTDCDELAHYIHQRNQICSNNLLEALKFNHGIPDNDNPVLPVELPPIPNEVMAEAVKVAFPTWVNSIKRIQHAVCAEYNITLSELLSQRRHKNIVRPRQVAMYLCKTLTDRSFPEIGRRFGGRDHTTVISAVHRIELICASDDVFRAGVETLAETLAEPCQ
jgi:hypothetical protein